MSTMQQELSVSSGLRTAAPAQHHSKIVKFVNEAAKQSADEAPT